VSGQLHATAALPPGKEPPGTHWIGGWVDPIAVLDAVVKRKIPNPRRESKPRTSIVQSVAQRYTDWAVTTLLIKFQQNWSKQEIKHYELRSTNLLLLFETRKICRCSGRNLFLYIPVSGGQMNFYLPVRKDNLLMAGKGWFPEVSRISS
jgi:hypothetical protein